MGENLRWPEIEKKTNFIGIKIPNPDAFGKIKGGDLIVGLWRCAPVPLTTEMDDWD